MIKKQTLKHINGVLTLIILLGGGVWFVTEIGDKTGCRAGWQPAEEMERYWKCITKSGVRYQICFEVYNSTNTENYWCKKGKIVKEEKVEDFSPQIHSGDIHCNNIGKCW